MNLLKGIPMKMITVAGTPSAGKTSVIAHLARRLLKEEIRVAVAKFDALETGDDRWYAREVGIPAIKALSDYVCPDHYYVSNLEEVFAWGKLQQDGMRWTTLNAGMAYKFLWAATLQEVGLTVNNLLDATYREHLATGRKPAELNAPGRSVLATWRMTF
jgi:hypothetical protein